MSKTVFTTLGLDGQDLREVTSQIPPKPLAFPNNAVQHLIA